MSPAAHWKEKIGVVFSRSHPSPINPEAHGWVSEIMEISIAYFVGKHINECLPRFHLSLRMLFGILFDLKVNFVRTATCRRQCICRLFLCPCGASKKQNNNEECLGHSSYLLSFLNELPNPDEGTANAHAHWTYFYPAWFLFIGLDRITMSAPRPE